MRWGVAVLGMALLSLTLAASALAVEPAEVTGAHDNLRTGWYPDEPLLAPDLVTEPRFKEVFKTPLHGQIYAQPLVANGTLLVVTEEDWDYGLDPVTGAVRWKNHFGEAVESGEGKTINCTDLEPHVGVTGTPVIDTATNIAYFVANEIVQGKVAWYMHAIELNHEGKEPNPFPVEIKGNAQNLSEEVEFEPAQELQRPALLMMNGVVYAGFGSHCDHEPYEGWIAGVSTSGKLETMWAASSRGGSIWQAGGGLVSDGPGQILFATANGYITEPGVWDPPPGPGNKPPEAHLDNSVVRVEVKPEDGFNELVPTDFFSPFNNKELDEEDIDLGSSAPVALPSEYFGTKSVPNLLVQEGKYGSVYLLNRDNLGGMGQGAGGKDKVVQELEPKEGGGVWGAAAVWPGDGGYIYIASVSKPATPSFPSSNYLRFYKYAPEGENPKISLEASSAEELSFGSGSPIVTSNGTESGSAVVWITWCPTMACEGKGGKEPELRAYYAVPPGDKEPTPFWTAHIGMATKFSRPDASDGHIYVGNREGVIGFSGPSLTPSSKSLELGSAKAGEQLKSEVTFTNTGTPLKVESVRASAPFEVTSVPALPAIIKPGETVTVDVTFRSASPENFERPLELTSEAGTIKVPLSASATAPAPNEPAKSPPPESGTTTTTTTLVSSNFGPGPAPELVSSEALLRLTNLELRASASRLSSHPRRLVIAYTLSAAGTVRGLIERRVRSHNCKPGVKKCFEWAVTKIKLKIAGHAGGNALTVNLGPLSAGDYRLAATPVNATGAVGITHHLEFKTVH